MVLKRKEPRLISKRLTLAGRTQIDCRSVVLTHRAYQGEQTPFERTLKRFEFV